MFIKMRVIIIGFYLEVRVVFFKIFDLMDEWLKLKINVLYRFDNIYKNLKKKKVMKKFYFLLKSY